jgi:hypothetical protein
MFGLCAEGELSAKQRGKQVAEFKPFPNPVPVRSSRDTPMFTSKPDRYAVLADRCSACDFSLC